MIKLIIYLKRSMQTMPNTGPSLVDLQIISNGFNYFTKSFIIQTSTDKYLFNCGENLVRCLKNTQRLNHIFLTRKTPQTLLGLPGFMLHMKAQGLSNVTLHAPFSLSPMYLPFNQTLKTYTFRFNEHNYMSSSFKFENEDCAIRAIPIDNQAFAYLIDFHNAPPSLSIEKLIEHQVPIGPLRAQLKEGHDVNLPNGRVVRPSDVFDYTKACNKIKLLILDFPSVDHLVRLYSNKEINDVNVMIHMSDSQVLNSKVYEKFLESKHQVEHIILDEQYPNIHADNMFNFQKCLNLIDEKIFPKIHREFDEQIISKYNEPNCIYGISYLRVNFRPKQLIVKDFCPKIDTHDMILDKLKIYSTEYNIDDILRKLHEEVATIRSQKKHSSLNYPKISFLGTGSSVSTQIRNVSSILVNLSTQTNILLDCGEGTLSQMRILLGKEKYEDELMKLKYIFVSHHHSDHHLGVFNLLIERNKCFKRRNLQVDDVYISLPLNLIEFFKKWGSFVDSESLNNHVHILRNEWFIPDDFRTRDFHFLRARSYEPDCAVVDRLCKYLNLSSIQIVPVLHTHESSGLILETNEEKPFKLVFSGDCRPSDTLVTYGQNCDLLIHESTFAETFEAEAIKKKHSTTQEAIQIGARMNAKHLFLWHFSQRYAKIPDTSDIDIKDKLSCAFDFMVIDRNDLEVTSRFNNIYKSLFAEAHGEIETKKKTKRAKMLE